MNRMHEIGVPKPKQTKKLWYLMEMEILEIGIVYSNIDILPQNLPNQCETKYSAWEV